METIMANSHADFIAALDKVNAGNATPEDVANLKAHLNDTNVTEAERNTAKTAIDNANQGDNNDYSTQRTRQNPTNTDKTSG